MQDDGAPLAGRGVLVTRPAQQNHRLARALERLGARVLKFPLIQLAGPSDPNAAQAALAELGRSDLAIFVSANAVRFACNLLPDLPGRLRRARIACVGDATAAALEAASIEVHLVPDGGSTSEALLAMDGLQAAAVQGREVAIVRGEGGRDLIAQVLDERGARVHPVEVYRREPPGGDLAAFLDAHAGAIHVAIVTSGESLARLAELGGMGRVQALPLVLPSDRVLEQAVSLGFAGPFSVPRRMNDAELAAAAARLAASVGVARTG